MFLYNSLIILSIFLLIFTLCIYHIYGISPPFVRQEVDDKFNDVYEQNYLANTTCTNNDFPNNEIQSVSYISNGRYLNSTIWLNALFFDPAKTISNYSNNTSFTEKPNLIDMGFSMVIDVISPFDRGIDYNVSYEWNQSQSRWDKIIYEVPSSSANKILSIVKNYSNFYGNDKIHNKGYVNFDFDLGVANFPDEYIIVFNTWKDIENKAKTL